MRRALLILLAIAALALPAGASAHPLGNFTTNQFSRIELSGERIYLLHVLDLAEIPTYQARAAVRRHGVEGYARRLARALGAGLDLRVDGRRRGLVELRRRIAFPAGAAGLRTTRLEVVYDGGLAAKGARRLVLENRNFSKRIGWREIVVRDERGARIASASSRTRSISDELLRYPKGLLKSPLDERVAFVSFTPGTLAGEPPGLTETREQGSDRSASKSESGFASLIERDTLSAGFVLVSLFVAMFWGAAHALTPGHGKAIVAAYMVGTRGTARHALFLGVVVTATHTIGVFALGLVTLALSEFIVPEELYPWLNLVSAVLVLAVGLTVLRFRLGAWLRPERARPGYDDHPRDQPHHHHDRAHGHHDHSHGHGSHQHVPAPGSGFRGLVAVGVSGGILPCPTALVVLLAAISLHRVAYGLVLIIAFSAGLAAAITAIALLAVAARRTFNRMSFDGRAIRLLPSASTLVIVGLGLAMTVRALPPVV
jgi:ABC-type nickel/cobalt efflux system permease component RcnA